MKRMRAILTSAAVLLGLGVTLNVGGCTKDSSLSPKEPQALEKVAQSDIGPIRILTVSPQNTTLRKGGYYAEKFIKASEGGVIEVGDDQVGRSRIVFRENDLPQDMTISFRWLSDGILRAEFGPDGTVFNNPVRVELSYKAADIAGSNENDLGVFYLNGDKGWWEFIGGEADASADRVSTYLSHFSEYGIGDKDP